MKPFALNNSEIQLVINMNPLRNKHQIFMVQTLTTVTTELTKYLSTSNKMSIKSDSIHLVCDYYKSNQLKYTNMQAHRRDCRLVN